MKEIHNARTTLLATVFNNLSAAAVVAGFIAPAASGQMEGAGRFLLGLIWIGIGAGLHALAQAILGRLTP